MRKWIIPTLSEILASNDTQHDGYGSHSCLLSASHEGSTAVDVTAQQWRVAIAALENLLQQIYLKHTVDENCQLSTQGVILAGPVPVISNPQLVNTLPSWTFTADSWQHQLLPSSLNTAVQKNSQVAREQGVLLPLISGDPLAREQFCLVLTAQFSLAMVLAENAYGVPVFLFSFEPEVVEQAWYALRARAALTTSESVLHLDELIQQYYPVAPDYRTVMHFSRLLLQHIPELPHEEIRNCTQNNNLELSHATPRVDVELLQAFAHEVRTPLTTIRTLTRLLLKRRDLATDAIKRLEIIDHECTEQIDRMELLFRAAELEKCTAKHSGTYLTAMSLTQVLQQSVPRWQKQASRRNLTLDVVLPQQLPTVVSDPKMLDQVLTGLIENFTRSLPPGSHIQVQVIPAGDQLKLQLLPKSQLEENKGEQYTVPPIRKSLGQLLTFQPETGNISLNMTATKQLFQAIGGKLIVRQRPHEGEVLTIFLPLDVKQTEYCS
ncbi:HAMP domain-containing histidine kinase [Gloeocapsopsis crepidinum LEGE 06123]|uniref:histidine kinase n=1 Tax=Gloeocapsopsis crepidinum LEGE 06123 TaxID=588587 RepID=A0ABR9UW89_9CHRO|nr:HAMP domain-containing sensor histidine kinase [Gloeocapsopsis crepidinum]MBE9192546.1 HAMP domain-containing histidine kinase [Gloeocapsopsis crepidinum LEGE 06123]